MIIKRQNILDFEKFYRAALINSISGFKSANLIGTISNTGNANVAIFNSVIHVGSNPPALGFLMRPVSVERHTYENIIETGFFTINHINKEIYRQAHQTSARYEKEVSEFEACGLTPEFTDTLTAPYVKESNIKLGLKYVEEQEIKYNGTIFIVGEILEIILPENIIAKDGYAEIENAGTITTSGLDGYHETETIARLPFANPRNNIYTKK